MTEFDTLRKFFTTSDGVGLSYIEKGSGPAIVLVHGWSQCAEEFKYQLSGLKQSHRVIAIDLRGHGQSEKPDYGYKIPRLAQDLFEFLGYLDLQDVALLGHSLGCSVIWSYLDLFGPRRIAKLILVDEPSCLVVNPVWSKEKIAAMGAGFTPDMAFEIANSIAGAEGVNFTKSMIASMFTEACDQSVIDWVIDCNLQFPRKHAATLLLNNIFQGWQDLIPRVNLPTLVIGGEVSVTPVEAVRWIADQINGSQLEIFDKDSGGSHFMFLENPGRFNFLISGFVKGDR